MRILVTGGAGFIGSHVVDGYIREGHSVWVVDDLSHGKREQVNPAAHFVLMDVRSPSLVDLIASERFDCINHHAAQMDVRLSVADPIHDAMINVVGTLNLLEAARLHRVGRMIFASTGGAVYGEQRHFPAAEQHPTNPMSPYGVAKRSVELYLECYRQVHGLQYCILRYANVYGPRQDPDGEAGVVAIFCGKILQNQHLSIYGEGKQTRDYVYVEDVARANLLALKYLTADCQLPAARCQLNPVFNIGTGLETSVNALAAMLLDAANTNCPLVHQPARKGEQQRSVIDPSLAQRVLGWHPEKPLHAGLQETLEWFRSQTTAHNPAPGR